MKNYTIFLIILISFVLGAVIGIKTYHPANFIHYKFLSEEIERCNSKGGVLQTIENMAVCNKNIYSVPLNTDVIDFIINKEVEK